MSGNRKQRRDTLRRKARQVETARVEALRREAVNFEGVTKRRAETASPATLEHIVKHGKRRRGLTGVPYGPLAIMASTR